MVKMTIVSTILAITASESWQIQQMDVKNEFFDGDLKTEAFFI